jgi:hypothetical protein
MQVLTCSESFLFFFFPLLAAVGKNSWHIPMSIQFPPLQVHNGILAFDQLLHRETYLGLATVILSLQSLDMIQVDASS